MHEICQKLRFIRIAAFGLGAGSSGRYSPALVEFWLPCQGGGEKVNLLGD